MGVFPERRHSNTLLQTLFLGLQYRSQHVSGNPQEQCIPTDVKCVDGNMEFIISLLCPELLPDLCMYKGLARVFLVPFSISDTGNYAEKHQRGLDKAYQPDLFRPFFWGFEEGLGPESKAHVEQGSVPFWFLKQRWPLDFTKLRLRKPGDSPF